MKASTLSDVYDVFNPEESLKGEKLKTYYVDRKSAIKEEVLWKIKSSTKPLKILFPAIRGNGNTTELNKLAEEAKELFVVFFNCKERLDMVNVDHVDLLLSIGLHIYECVKDETEIDEKLKDELEDWSLKIIDKVKEEQDVLEMGGGISTILKLTGAMRTQTSTKEVVRKTVEPKLNELLLLINRVIANAEEHLGKIFVIVDDLDKIAPKQAENLFFGYSTTLIQLQCNVIYTIPRSLQFSEKYQWISRYFDSKFSIPNIYVVDRDGNHNTSNWDLMRNVALSRMEHPLIDDDALDYAVEMSGGVMHDFIRVIREAAAKAHGKGRIKIMKEDVGLVVSDIRNDYLKFLSGKDIDMLRKVTKNHRKLDDQRFSDFLFSLTILEYINDEVWYDVHPIVKGTLTRA